MFRIFRKARSSALNEKRTGRFISYAIGEILLVVIGILIALQIDNWNDERLLVLLSTPGKDPQHER